MQAQESLNASGNDANGSGGKVAYSVGQIVYTTISNNNGITEQGVQHAYETLTLFKNESFLNISAILFPNPTADKSSLNIENFNNQKLTYFIFDNQGKLIESNNIKAAQTTIDLHFLNSDIYYIDIKNDNKQLKSFKIIKNE